MNLDVLVLALASAARPAGIAGLYALLSASSLRRLPVAYVAAGFTFSVAVGVMVVAIFHGAGIDYRGTDVYAALELLGGLAALGFAIAVGTGRRELPSRDSGTHEESTIILRLHNPTVTTAAVAGVATHVPGLFYIVALNAIIAEGPSFASGVLQVLLFNAIWFAAAIAAVVVFLLRPGVAPRALTRVAGWLQERAIEVDECLHRQSRTSAARDGALAAGSIVFTHDSFGVGKRLANACRATLGIHLINS